MFALFCGDFFYPCGGWGDWYYTYRTLEDALVGVYGLQSSDWWHIVELPQGTIVQSGRRND